MRLLVPLDVHGCADAVVERALWLARLAGPAARIDLLVVAPAATKGEVSSLELDGRALPLAVSLPTETAALLQGFARLVAHNGALGDVVVVAGAPAPAILAACEKRRPDLLVMGSHARRGLRRAVFGSVAEAVLRAAPCAVLVEPAGRELEERPTEEALQAEAERIG
jgi:nucleotide-binding universal stress UspA family protein